MSQKIRKIIFFADISLKNVLVYLIYNKFLLPLHIEITY